MILKATDMIGEGIYTPSEAARMARMPTQMFNRWFYASADREPVLTPRFDDVAGERVVCFWDLIQAVGVRNLRTHRAGQKLSLQNIRQSIQIVKSEYEIDFPLARKHTLYVYANRLILRIGDDYIGLDKKIDKDQLYHHAIIAPYMQEIQFDTKSMAQQWQPLESKHYSVQLRGDRRFGMPTIEPGGILVEALAEAAEAEGSIEAAAEAFDTKSEAVNLARKYQYDYLAIAS